MDVKVIEKFIKKNTEPYARYNSWNHCYKAFAKETSKKTKSFKSVKKLFFRQGF